MGDRAAASRAAAGPPPAAAPRSGRVRQAKQHVARKELQRQAKQEYLRQLYESADRVEGDRLVYELKPSSPHARAQQARQAQQAQLNRSLAAQIPQLASWADLGAFAQRHRGELNFLGVVALATRAAALRQALGPPPPEPGGPQLLPALAAMVLEASSWFQPVHFAAAAAAMAACGLEDPSFWVNLVVAAEHRVAALSFAQLAQVLAALAIVGFTPQLPWLERSYRQACKHLHVARPADVCAVMWAWGEMGYVPRDRLFMNQVKIISRRAFSGGQLSGAALVQLMHGVARMPKYAPNPGWLLALTQQVRPSLPDLPPGLVVDLLLSLASLGFRPRGPWMEAALARLQDGFAGSGSGVGVAAEGPLLLAPADPQSGGWGGSPAGIQSPGLLRGAAAAGSEQLDGEGGPLPEQQELEELFAAAEAADGDEDGEAAGLDTSAEAEADALPGAPDAAALLGAWVPAYSASGSATATDSQQQQQQDLRMEQLAVLCWCLRRLEYSPRPAWAQLLAEQLLLRHGDASCEALVDALLGLLGTGHLPVGRLQDALLSRAAELAPSMPAEVLRRLCQALAELERGIAAHPAGTQLPDGDIGGGGGSGGHLRRYCDVHRGALADAIVHRQGIIMWQSSTAQLADVLAFAAAAGARPSHDYMATATSLAAEKLGGGGGGIGGAAAAAPAAAPAAALSTLLWALARLGFKPHPKLLHQLLAGLQRGLHLLGSQELADAGWALCTLKHRPGSVWLSQYLHQAASRAAAMPAQALTDTLWALACFAAQPDREWLKRLLLAVGRRLDEGQLSAENAAVVMWALQQLGLDPGEAAAAGGEQEAALRALVAAVGGAQQQQQQQQQQ